jgi:LmbE family N-acetylglucosaminyl deacetylase
MKRTTLLLWLLVASCLAANAQPAANSSADILLQLKKLNVLGSVLYIAAHPDDENNGLLPYLAKEKLYRTGYLSLTRGDGGQNLIGSEQGIELGLIRTQELLAARRMDGAEQFFTRAYEFGFSKSSEEALRIWDKQKILSDVVWVIRKYQPDVIIKRFPPDARAGHGHHAASAILADEAFIAAADPNKFPEQLAYVQPWQAKRIVWNTFNFGGNNTTSNDQLKMDVGGFNPLLGKSYGEIGGEARSMHKSQGEGRPRRRGEIYEFFATTAGDTAKVSLMDGINTEWSRMQGGESIQQAIGNAIANLNFAQPSLSVPALVNIYKAIKATPESTWRTKKLQDVQSIIESCMGLVAEAVTGQEYAVQGDTLKMSLNFINRSTVPVVMSSFSIQQGDYVAQPSSPIKVVKTTGGGSMYVAHAAQKPKVDSSIKLILNNNKLNSIPYSVKLADDAPISQPYWLANGIKEGYFDVHDQLLIGDAQNKPAYTAHINLQIQGEDFIIDRPVEYKVVDPVKGEIYEPLTIVPKAMVYISPGVILSNVVPAYSPVISVNVNSNIDAAGVPVSLALQNGSRTDVFANRQVDLKKGAGTSFNLKLSDVYHKGQHNYAEPVVTLKLNGRDEVFTQNISTIKYDHIPYINYFYKDNLRVIDAEVKTAGKKIGYIIGAGDKVPEALTAMGYTVSYLNEDEITDNNLKQFDAIVVGIRAYNIYEYLSNKNDVFNRYVQNGGNLIAQYIKSNQVGSKRVKVGPYPFTISPSLRVTEENAKVNILLPQHPAFNYPNKITQQDFEGWVQERSTYQVDQSDEHFEKLLSMNDTSEKESNGSLAIAKYGKGNFVYASLVLFRQLPAGVPGAYRLMANLIALPKNK